LSFDQLPADGNTILRVSEGQRRSAAYHLLVVKWKLILFGDLSPSFFSGIAWRLDQMHCLGFQNFRR
jgi:hypothetical protein